MKSDLEKLIQAMKQIRLPDDEKQRIRGNLLVFMKNSQTQPQPAQAVSKTQTGFASFLAVFKNTMRAPATIAIVLVLGFGGALSAAAQGTLPGDTLYPIKTGFNEQIRAALAFSPNAKAAVHALLAQKRLEEAEKLASQSRLDASVRSELEKNFTEHADHVSQGITRLKESGDEDGAAEVSSNFEAALQAHETILSELNAKVKEQGERGREDSHELEGILNNVQARFRSATAAREKSETDLGGSSQTDVKAAAEGKMTAAQNKISTVKGFFEQFKSKLNAASQAAVEARITDATDVFAQGQAKLSAGEYGAAFILFQRAQRLAQNTKLLITASIDLQFELKDSSEGREGSDSQKPPGSQEDSQNHDAAHPELNDDHATSSTSTPTTTLDIEHRSGEELKLKIGE